MTIKEVCEKFDITPDTLRYYERVGAIPTVNRTVGRVRDYTEEDLKWVKNAICLRRAGVSVEMLVEYVRLSQQGDGTLQERCDLLKEARKEVVATKQKYEEALQRLNQKIFSYEEAIRTGVIECDFD